MIKFKAIRPVGIPKDIFEQSFDQASFDLSQKVTYDFREATNFFKEKPVFIPDIKRTSRSVTIIVNTDSLAFHYYDLGNGGPTRIIKPIRAKALHWVDKSNKDVFVKWVHGYKGFEVSKKIKNLWDKKIARHFDKYLKDAIKQSGHAMK